MAEIYNPALVRELTRLMKTKVEGPTSTSSAESKVRPNISEKMANLINGLNLPLDSKWIDWIVSDALEEFELTADEPVENDLSVSPTCLREGLIISLEITCGAKKAVFKLSDYYRQQTYSDYSENIPDVSISRKRIDDQANNAKDAGIEAHQKFHAGVAKDKNITIDHHRIWSKFGLEASEFGFHNHGLSAGELDIIKREGAELVFFCPRNHLQQPMCLNGLAVAMNGYGYNPDGNKFNATNLDDATLNQTLSGRWGVVLHTDGTRPSRIPIISAFHNATTRFLTLQRQTTASFWKQYEGADKLDPIQTAIAPYKHIIELLNIGGQDKSKLDQAINRYLLNHMQIINSFCSPIEAAYYAFMKDESMVIWTNKYIQKRGLVACIANKAKDGLTIEVRPAPDLYLSGSSSFLLISNLEKGNKKDK